MIVLSGERAAVVRLCFLPGSRLLVAGYEYGPVVGWNLDSAELVFTWDTGADADTLAASPDGRRVYAQARSGTDTVPHTYDRRTGTAKRLAGGPDFALNPAGNRLLTNWYDPRKMTTHLRCWKVSKSGAPTPAWTGPATDVMYYCPTFFPDGKRFAACEVIAERKADRSGCDLVIGDAVTGRVRVQVPADDFSDDDLLVHPKGTCAVGVIDSKLVIWDAATGERMAEPQNPDSKRPFTGTAFHPSGQWLATSSNDATVRIWDAERWKPARTFTWKVGKVKSVAYSPDGTLAAAGGDRGKIVVWDVDE
jgi:WD40 repeat protein